MQPDPMAPPPLPGAAPTMWRLWHFFAAFVGGAIAANLAFAFLAVDLGSSVIDLDAVSSNQLFAVVIPAQHVGTLTVLGLILLAKRRSFSESLGFELDLRQWWWLPLGAAIALVVGFLTIPLAALLGVEENPQAVVDDFAEVSAGLPLLVAVLALVVLTPITEEILYRGVLQRAVGRWLSTVPMIVVTSILWGLAHLLDPGEGDAPWWAQGLVTFVPITIFGVIAAIVTVRSDGRLGRAIFLHGGWNLLGVIALLLSAGSGSG